MVENSLEDIVPENYVLTSDGNGGTLWISGQGNPNQELSNAYIKNLLTASSTFANYTSTSVIYSYDTKLNYLSSKTIFTDTAQIDQINLSTLQNNSLTTNNFEYKDGNLNLLYAENITGLYIQSESGIANSLVFNQGYVSSLFTNLIFVDLVSTAFLSANTIT